MRTCEVIAANLILACTGRDGVEGFIVVDTPTNDPSHGKESADGAARNKPKMS